MKTVQPQVSIGIAGRPVSTRIISIDVFRGLTMIVMIFVNALSEMHGLPWWTYHAHAHEDFMTYVDMVYPFFLFIVGLSIPLSVRQRLRRNASLPALWAHMVLRSFYLVVLGLILANAEKADAARMGFGGNVWALTALIGAALYLNVYPESPKFGTLFRLLRYLGLVSLVIMLAVFQRTDASGHVAWLDPSYPEILGLIGFTYFSVCLLYIPTRRLLWAPAIWLVLLVAFNALSIAHIVPLPGRIPLWFWPFDNGAMPSIAMAGIVTSSIFLEKHRWHTPRLKVRTAATFGVAMLLAGWAFAPLGISKIRATPTWSLVSIGAAVLVFCLLYLVCDIRKHTTWAFFARPAGSNALLTYLLPDLWFFLLAAAGVSFMGTHFNAGIPGVLMTIVFTALVLLVAGVLTRARVRLQL